MKLLDLSTLQKVKIKLSFMDNLMKLLKNLTLMKLVLR